MATQRTSCPAAVSFDLAAIEAGAKKEAGAFVSYYLRSWLSRARRGTEADIIDQMCLFSPHGTAVHTTPVEQGVTLTDAAGDHVFVPFYEGPEDGPQLREEQDRLNVVWRSVSRNAVVLGAMTAHLDEEIAANSLLMGVGPQKGPTGSPMFVEKVRPMLYTF